MSGENKKTVITYGTFDLFHIGHLKLLERLKNLGGRLIVAVSTDDFNATKGKRSIIKFEDRISIVRAIKFVDLAIPEESWDQKVVDIKKYEVDIFVMGDDWSGKFDHLKELCEVCYLPRTENISSTEIKKSLSIFSREKMVELKAALDVIANISSELK